MIDRIKNDKIRTGKDQCPGMYVAFQQFLLPFAKKSSSPVDFVEDDGRLVPKLYTRGRIIKMP